MMVNEAREADMEQSNRWRSLIALFANQETRTVAARIMLGETLDAATEGLSASRRRRVGDAVARSGLIDAELRTLDPAVFRSILEANPVPPREGVDRFLDDGRIRQYPAGRREREALLAWVAGDAFAPGEVVSEREVNARLARYTDDVAVLRRYLVDSGLVERRIDGTRYALAGPPG
jgi:hypothetical protein